MVMENSEENAIRQTHVTSPVEAEMTAQSATNALRKGYHCLEYLASRRAIPIDAEVSAIRAVSLAHHFMVEEFCGSSSARRRCDSLFASCGAVTRAPAPLWLISTACIGAGLDGMACTLCPMQGIDVKNRVAF